MTVAGVRGKLESVGRGIFVTTSFTLLVNGRFETQKFAQHRYAGRRATTMYIMFEREEKRRFVRGLSDYQ
jgi:hypothetical protein